MHIGCNTVGDMVRTRGYPWLCHCMAYPGPLRLATVQLGNTPILTPDSSDFDSLSMSQIHNPQVCDLGTHPNHCLCNTADNHDPRAPIPWLRHCMAYPGTLRLTTVQPQYVAILTPQLSIFDQYLMSWISDFMIWTSNSGLVDVYPRGVVFIIRMCTIARMHRYAICPGGHHCTHSAYWRIWDSSWQPSDGWFLVVLVSVYRYLDPRPPIS